MLGFVVCLFVYLVVFIVIFFFFCGFFVLFLFFICFFSGRRGVYLFSFIY